MPSSNVGSVSLVRNGYLVALPEADPGNRGGLAVADGMTSTLWTAGVIIIHLFDHHTARMSISKGGKGEVFGVLRSTTRPASRTANDTK